MHWELVFRIAVATLMGSVIGYERDLHGRPAGLRTHTLVALAAATFMVISTHFVYFQHYGRDDLIMVDSSRIAASIVSGMGFLAGGAIMRTGLSVQGLTTAAGLWLVGAIGMAAGAGMYLVGGFVTVVGVVALTLLRRLEDKDVLRRKIGLVLGETATVQEILSRLRELNASGAAVEYDRDLAEHTLSVTLEVRFPQELGIERIIETLEKEKDVRRVRLAQ